jgi:4-amino-4-deoxy-L-arabinose transferase-like glycosyltransferase
MAKKKNKTPPLATEVPSIPATSVSLPPSAVARFLETHAILLAVAAIVLGVVQIVSTYSETALTWDEPGHMACGLQYLADHVYLYEVQHPPLARVASALGPFLAGARPLHTPNQDLEGVNVMYQGGDPAGMLNRMRLGILPFFILNAVVVFLWARRYFGGAAAVLATLLFALEPTVLAHAGLATTDMPLAACLTAAFFALLVWAEDPTWLHSVVLGLFTALAVVSKFTALGFFPAAAVFALGTWLAVTRPGFERVIVAAKSRLLPFLLAVAVGAVVIWAVYSFSFGTPKGWGFALPAPGLFEGVDFAILHNSKGHPAYFMGEISRAGWWYFFPVLLLVKTPIGWLLLTCFGVGAMLAHRARLAYWMPAAFVLGVLLPGMTSHVNIGLRHVLPVYSGLAILAGIGLLRLIEDGPRKKWAGALAIVLPAWLLISGLTQRTNYLAYFNELAGAHPEHIVVDSDLDWGQDAIRLSRRLKQLGATSVSFSTLNLSPSRLVVWPGLPPVHPIDPIKPAEGWTAVSPTLWMVREYGLEHQYPNMHPWFTYIQPQERVGSLFLYYVAPGSIPPELR